MLVLTTISFLHLTIGGMGAVGQAASLPPIANRRGCAKNEPRLPVFGCVSAERRGRLPALIEKAPSAVGNRAQGWQPALLKSKRACEGIARHPHGQHSDG